MKRTLFYICTAILLGLCNACDIISENDRIREGEMITYSRYVLVEDYTGQLCVNCPRGAEILNQLKTTTDGHVITVAIHGNRRTSTPITKRMPSHTLPETAFHPIRPLS